MRGRRIAWIVAGGGLIVAAFIVFAPMLFSDETEAREVLTALLLGLVAVALAIRVIVQMRLDLERQQIAAVEKPYADAARRDPDDISRYSRARHRRGLEPEAPKPMLPLVGVDLREAVLPAADLADSVLTGALLEGANLHAATLRDSRLAGADLRRANLREADLRGADLSGALIGKAQLDGAIYDDRTTWPKGTPPPYELGAVHIKDIR